jgi:hypothetical protein
MSTDRTVYSLSNSKLKLEFHPPEVQALTAEIYNHKPLLILLAEQADKDFYMQLCEIAAYCNVLLEGTYTRDDIIEICEKLTWELKKKNSILVLPLDGETLKVDSKPDSVS